MRLYVYVIEARGLPSRGGGGGELLFYAKVTMGKKQRFRTRAVEPAPSGAAWNEEFALVVGADEEEVEVAVAQRQRDGRRRRGMVGVVRLPVPAASAELATAAVGERRSVPPTWFTLEPAPEHHRRKGSDAEAPVDCGAYVHQFASAKLLDAIDIFFSACYGLPRSCWLVPPAGFWVKLPRVLLPLPPIAARKLVVAD
jgi:hypothetical protein